MIENHKHANIVKWLNLEITSERFMYEIFLEYNPEYPDHVKKWIGELFK